MSVLKTSSRPHRGLDSDLALAWATGIVAVVTLGATLAMFASGLMR